MTQNNPPPPLQVRNNKNKIIIAFLALFFFIALAFYIQKIFISKWNTKFLLAMQINDDGIKNVKGILNKNLVRFPQKQKKCWNTKPRWHSIDGCEKPENQIAEGSYFIKNGLSGFDLVLQEAEIDEEHLSENYRLEEDSIKGLYAIPKPNLNDFYRKIYIEYSGKDKNLMIVASTVYFKSFFGVKKYSTAILLANLGEFHE